MKVTPRRLRSASLRHTRLLLADLPRRRTHYERVAQSHIQSLRQVAVPKPDCMLSQLTPTRNRHRRNKKQRRNKLTAGTSGTDSTTTNDAVQGTGLKTLSSIEERHDKKEKDAHKLDFNHEDDEDDEDEDEDDENPVSLCAEAAQEALDLKNEDDAVAHMRLLLNSLKALANFSDEGNSDNVTSTTTYDNGNEIDNIDKNNSQRKRGRKKKSKKSSKNEKDDTDIQGLAEFLATDRFLVHDSSDLRLLTACCLVEILRIFAPDPPVQQRELNDVCILFIEQLAVIASPNDPMEAFRFSLLEQLATIKAFVIFSDNDHVVCDLFACVYAVCKPHQSLKVRQYLVDILVSVLDEMESPNPGNEILDAVLAPLIPALRYSHTAVDIAEKVLSSSEKCIQFQLCSLLNESIRALKIEPQALPISLSCCSSTSATTSSHFRRGHSAVVASHGLGHGHQRKRSSPVKNRDHDTDGEGSSTDIVGLSEHHPYICDLIIAVGRVVPDVLIFVLPNLEPRIRTNDLSTRLGAVHLLARLFITNVDMATSYPSLFTEFLNSRADLKYHVRGLVVLSLGDLLIMHPKHRQNLDTILFERIHDLNEHVRVAALRSTVRATDFVTDETLHRALSRLQDKSDIVRKETFSQIISLSTCVTKQNEHGNDDITGVGIGVGSEQVLMEPEELEARGESVDGIALDVDQEKDCHSISLAIQRKRRRRSKKRGRSSVEESIDDNDSDKSGRLINSAVSDGDEGGDRLEFRLLRMSEMPSMLLTSYIALRRANVLSVVCEYEKSIFEKIFMASSSSKPDDKLSVRRGLRRMSLFISLLSKSMLVCFDSMIAEKAKARSLLLKIAQLRLSGRASVTAGASIQSQAISKTQAQNDAIGTKDKTTEDQIESGAENVQSGTPSSSMQQQMSRGHIEEARRVSEDLGKFFRTANSNTEVGEHCRSVATAVDLKIYDRILKVLDCSCVRLAEANEAGVDAVSRLGSKSDTGIFLAEYILPRCRPGPFSTFFFAGMCDLAVSLSCKNRDCNFDGEKLEVEGDDDDDDDEINSDVDSEDESDEDEDEDEMMKDVANRNRKNSRLEQHRKQLIPRLLFGVVRYFKVIAPKFGDSIAGATDEIIRLITLPIQSDDWSAEIVLCGLKLAWHTPRERVHNFDTEQVAKVVNSLLRCDHARKAPQYGAKLAKWASRLVIKVASERERDGATCEHLVTFEELQKLMTESFDGFSGNLTSIVGSMTAASQMAKHAREQYKKIALRCFDFTRLLLNGKFNDIIGDWLLSNDNECDEEEGIIEEEKQLKMSEIGMEVLQILGRGETEIMYLHIGNVKRACASEVVAGACKVLVRGLDQVDMNEEYDGVVHSLVCILNRSFGDVFNVSSFATPENESASVCTDQKDEDGIELEQSEQRSSGEIKSSSATLEVKQAQHELAPMKITSLLKIDHVMRAACRLSAARALLYLARHRPLAHRFAPETMIATMLVAQDEHPLGRICFAEDVKNGVIFKRLPFRWIVCLSLMAVDPVPENEKKVRDMIIQALQRRRNACETLRRNGKSRYIEMLPESTVAELMWVLANLPGVEIEEEAGFPESRTCIELMLDCLLESKEYANVLNEYIETVSIAEDATETMEDGIGKRSNRLKEFSRIGSEVLRKKMAGRKWELMENVPKFTLPRDLFRIVTNRRDDDGRGGEGGVGLKPTMLDVAKGYDRRRDIERGISPIMMKMDDMASPSTKKTTGGNQGSGRGRGRGKRKHGTTNGNDDESESASVGVSVSVSRRGEDDGDENEGIDVTEVNGREYRETGRPRRLVRDKNASSKEGERVISRGESVVKSSVDMQVSVVETENCENNEEQVVNDNEMEDGKAESEGKMQNKADAISTSKYVEENMESNKKKRAAAEKVKDVKSAKARKKTKQQSTATKVGEITPVSVSELPLRRSRRKKNW